MSEATSATPTMERVLEGLMEVIKNNNSHHPEVPHTRSHIEQFQKLKPPTFDGKEDPLVAQSWTLEMEKIFEVMECSEEEKVKLATFMFTDEAYRWWLTIKESEPNMKWDRFKEVFNTMYFPPSVKEQMIAEFLNLQQGNMTVTEYAAKFTRLSRFATYVVDTEDRKARKFEGGLKDDFKTKVKLLKLPTYAEVLDRALILESDEKELAKRRDHKRAGSNESNQFHYRNQFSQSK
ncbi:uncharacterized protein LOC131320822 [Rhododendron vialii]|uniref:uncharacterized protein LOC131320821 n=1 Tax=Rhododendron vialii TaxID=182163 RepID=UPI00265FE434|nr:uncharacterized protein LOC131320821 [Rhododendron vialii]XP_058207684.1 uncharacterized protein LOC131320822 [Rhododendron vialii]